LVAVDERIMKLYEGEKLGFEEELKILKEHFEASSL
jgi:UDP-glucose 4-epimerase